MQIVKRRSDAYMLQNSLLGTEEAEFRGHGNGNHVNIMSVAVETGRKIGIAEMSVLYTIL